jgi:hypothetical protein
VTRELIWLPCGSVVECEMAWSFETMARLPDGQELTVLAPGAVLAFGGLSPSSRVFAERLCAWKPSRIKSRLPSVPDQAKPAPFGSSGMVKGAAVGGRRGRISRGGPRKPGMTSSPKSTSASHFVRKWR